jgi:hypothetical protein
MQSEFYDIFAATTSKYKLRENFKIPQKKTFFFYFALPSELYTTAGIHAMLCVIG